MLFNGHHQVTLITLIDAIKGSYLARQANDLWDSVTSFNNYENVDVLFYLKNQF